MTKKILYLDMDGVLVDYPSGLAQLSPETLKEYEGRLYAVPGVFFTHWCLSLHALELSQGGVESM